MNKSKTVTLILLDVIAALSPYIASRYIFSTDVLILSITGLIIWLSVTMLILKMVKWQKKFFWLFLLLPVAAGPILFMGLVALSFVSSGSTP